MLQTQKNIQDPPLYLSSNIKFLANSSRCKPASRTCSEVLTFHESLQIWPILKIKIFIFIVFMKKHQTIPLVHISPFYCRCRKLYFQYCNYVYILSLKIDVALNQIVVLNSRHYGTAGRGKRDFHGSERVIMISLCGGNQDDVVTLCKLEMIITHRIAFVSIKITRKVHLESANCGKHLSMLITAAEYYTVMALLSFRIA